MATMNNFYTLEDYQNSKFDQLPKVLRKGKYKALSNNARVLYAVLKERHELSVKNRWVDDEGKIFFYFAQRDLAEECCISSSTVWRALQDLHKIGLIETKRQGLQLNNIMYLCKPDLIEEYPDATYPKTVHGERSSKEPKDNFNCDNNEFNVGEQTSETLDSPLISQNDKSGLVKMTIPDSSKRLTNNTKDNNTELNQSINRKTEGVIDYSYEFIKKLIDYESLIKSIEYQKEDIDGIVNIIFDVINSGLDSMLISKEDMPVWVIRSRYLKLNMYHIFYVLDCLSEYDKKIRDPKSFIRTALYNAPSTISAHYTNKVSNDIRKLE